MSRSGGSDLLAVGLLGGALAAGIAIAGRQPTGSPRAIDGAASPAPLSHELVTPTAAYKLRLARGRIDVVSADKLVACEVALSLVVDGVAHPVAITPSAANVRAGANANANETVKKDVDGKEAVRGNVVVDVGGRSLSVGVRIAVGRAGDADAITLALDAPTPFPDGVAALALRAELATRGASLFVSGVGDVTDVDDVRGPSAVVAFAPHPMGFASSVGDVGVHLAGDAGELAASITSPPLARATGPRVTDLRLVLGASAGEIWRALYAGTAVDTSLVRGRLAGGDAALRAHARVFGLDAAGAVRLRTTTNDDGVFEVYAPRDVVTFYAALDGGRASAPVSRDARAASDAPMVLEIPNAGDVRVTVTDGDTFGKLTARLFFHGIEGTLDPSFGPDYRASGAGPLIDALRGEVTTTLSPGRYRISASKGLEWSIDAQEITVASAQHADVALTLRHVVPTPGVVGCDLHVHARPSFDTPVTTEDRVLSLVAAGVDFAVPTEHNIIGDYGPALSLLALTPELAWVHGVEVTTYTPRFGHFGVFPYSKGPVPPYRATTAAAILAAARKGDENRVVQLNHPRMGFGIGYFAVKHYSPEAPSAPAGVRTDFDTIEVYNGYDLGAPERVERVMGDWFSLLNRGSHIVATGSSDAHRIQYHWAGYPRTFVRVGADADGPRHPLDTDGIVTAIKAGRVTVSSGPLIDLTVGTASIGDTVVAAADAPSMTARIRVHAAPWVDVTSVDLVVAGRVVRTLSVPSRPTYVGPEAGTLAEAQARTLRIDEEITVPLSDPAFGTLAKGASTWMCAVARGSRRMDDVLPFMPVAPLGFTNPIWIARTAPRATHAPEDRTP